MKQLLKSFIQHNPINRHLRLSSLKKIGALLIGLLTLLTFSIPSYAKHHPKKTHYQYSYVVKHHRYSVLSKAATEQYATSGTASWYGHDAHGKLTAMGTKFNMHAMTAASKVLPLGTLVRVTNLTNQKSVVVKINDRGPFIHNRIIDLSYAAAEKLGYHKSGLAKVKVTTI
jgi:rare lipoprotein A